MQNRLLTWLSLALFFVLASTAANADRFAFHAELLTPSEQRLLALSLAVNEHDPETFVTFAENFVQSADSPDILMRILNQIMAPPYGRWIGQWRSARTAEIVAPSLRAPRNAQVSEPVLDRPALELRVYQSLVILEALVVESTRTPKPDFEKIRRLNGLASDMIETVRFVIESGLPPRKIQTSPGVPQIFEVVFQTTLNDIYKSFLMTTTDSEIQRLKNKIFAAVLRQEQKKIAATPFSRSWLRLHPENHSVVHKFKLPGRTAHSLAEAYPRLALRGLDCALLLTKKIEN